MPKATITINEVATRAGVSKKTVSRVLNKEPYVTQATLAKVKKAMAELNYSPNPQARGLASSKSFLLALIYDNPNTNYVSEAMLGALSQCTAAGFELVVRPCSDDSQNKHEEIIDFLLKTKIDGALLLPPVSESAEFISKLEKAKCKFVRIIAANQGDALNTVKLDSKSAAAEVAEHFIHLKHSNIGFIRGPQHSASAEERHRGFAGALLTHGIKLSKPFITVGDSTFQSGLDCADKLLNVTPRPTAIFASNDEMALGAIVATQRRGLKIPEDISIVGFDDSPQAAKIWPALTTLNPSTKAMATTATQKLIALCRKDPKTALSLPSQFHATFIQRQTTAKRS